MATCAGCAGAMRDPAMLCGRCEGRLITVLRELPGLHATLGALLQPETRPREHGRGTREAPLPCSLAALNLRGPGGIRDTVVSWAQVICVQLGVAAPLMWRGWDGGDATSFACSRILCRLPWVRAVFPRAGEMLADLERLHAAARAVVFPPPGRVELGRCPSLVDDDQGDEQPGPCPGVLKASTGDGVIRCSSCGSTWAPHQWLLLGRVLDRPLPTEGVPHEHHRAA